MSAYRSLNDVQLTDLLKTGDHAAFAEIYQRYWKKLLYLAVHKAGDYMDGENIVQDIFVSLWDRRERLSISSGLQNYLVVSVKYRVIKLLAKQRTHQLHHEDGSLAFDVLDDSTRQYLEFDALQLQLENLICKLPEKAVLVFKMHQEGLSHRDIAAETGMTEKAVNAQLVRTRKTLRSALGSFMNATLL